MKYFFNGLEAVMFFTSLIVKNCKEIPNSESNQNLDHVQNKVVLYDFRSSRGK